MDDVKSTKHRHSHDVDDRKHKTKKRHRHDDEGGRHKHKKAKERPSKTGDGTKESDGEDMWVEKNIDMDGERVRVTTV